MAQNNYLERLVSDKRIPKGDTLLHFTAKQNRPRILELLVKIPGLDVNAQNWAGRTPLMVACVAKDFESCKVLVKVPGIDLDRTNTFSHTALQIAALNGCRSICELLVERKADVLIRCDNGSLCNVSAQKLGMDDLVDYLEPIV